MTPPEHSADPFIVTATLPADLHGWADALRRAHFPPERNHLAAHVTLFHALPPSQGEQLRRLLAGLAAEHAPPPARLEGLMNLGRGTALALSSPQLLAIRARIAEHCHGLLTAQDQHKPRLHVTIQNKVTAAAARQLQAQLAPQIQPRAFAFRGLELHIYRGPHWEEVARWPFRGQQGA